MVDKKQTVLSWVFETHDLRKGERIKQIRKELRDYSLKEGFNRLPEIKQDSRINYNDELITVLPGESYYDGWDSGRKFTANTEIVRLYSEFRAKGWEEFDETQRFQKIHDNIIDYSMKNDFYLVCAMENPTKPPILVHLANFHMFGGGDYRSVAVDLAGNIIHYMRAQQKRYSEPGPQFSESHKRFLEEQERKNKG